MANVCRPPFLGTARGNEDPLAREGADSKVSFQPDSQHAFQEDGGNAHVAYKEKAKFQLYLHKLQLNDTVPMLGAW